MCNLYNTRVNKVYEHYSRYNRIHVYIIKIIKYANLFVIYIFNKLGVMMFSLFIDI